MSDEVPSISRYRPTKHGNWRLTCNLNKRASSPLFLHISFYSPLLSLTRSPFTISGQNSSHNQTLKISTPPFYHHWNKHIPPFPYPNPNPRNIYKTAVHFQKSPAQVPMFLKSSLHHRWRGKWVTTTTPHFSSSLQLQHYILARKPEHEHGLSWKSL